MARTKETWNEAVGGARWATLLPPAPGELRIVQAFLNTDDPKSATEELASPRALAEWLSRWGLLSGDVELGDAELEQALDVRGGFRALVRTNLGGGRIDAATAERLDRAAEAALLRVRFDSGGENRFETAADGFEGALGHLFRKGVAPKPTQAYTGSVGMRPRRNAVKKSDLARRQKSRFLPEWMLRDVEVSLYSSPDPLSTSTFETRIRRYDWSAPSKGPANVVLDCYTELL